MAGDPLLQCFDKGGRLVIHYQMVRQNAYGTGSGGIAESNAAQVRAVRQIIEGLGLEIATPDDARRILALKGSANVAF